MSKVPNIKFVFLLIAIQMTAAITVGSLVLLTKKSTILEKGTQIGVVSVENQDIEHAIQLSKAYYDSYLKDGKFEFFLEEYSFQIPFNEIDLKIDYEWIKEDIEDNLQSNGLTNLINEKKNRINETKLIPKLSLNEAKLRTELEFYAQRINRAPIDAKIRFDGKGITINEASSGMLLNIDNTIKTVLKDSFEHLTTPFVLKLDNNFEVQSIKPEVTKESLMKYKDLLVHFSLPIKKDELLSVASENENFAINNGEEFSFNRVILERAEVGDDEKKNLKMSEEANKLASCIYAAALQLGGNQIVYREQALKPTEYIAPGLEAALRKEEDDLQFINKTGKDYMLVIQQTDHDLTVALAGEKSETDIIYCIESQIVKELKPMVIYSQNPKMKENETKVIVEGEFGQIVNVYSYIKKNSSEKSKTFLYRDTYPPSERVIEIGTGIKIEELK